MNVTYALNI